MNVDHNKYEKNELINKYVEKLKGITASLIEKFNLLVTEVDSLLPIKQDNLAGETDRNIVLYHKYVTRLTEERRQMFILRGKRDEIEGELQDYYRHHWDGSTKLSEVAINKYTMAHPVFIAVNTLVKDYESLVLYIESVVGGFRDRGFAIKNLIELRKMELGLN